MKRMDIFFGVFFFWMVILFGWLFSWMVIFLDRRTIGENKQPGKHSGVPFY